MAVQHTLKVEDAGVDFNMLQKRKNPDYDPNVTGSKMFLTDKSGGQLYNTLSRAQATNLLKQKTLVEKILEILEKINMIWWRSIRWFWK